MMHSEYEICLSFFLSLLIASLNKRVLSRSVGRAVEGSFFCSVWDNHLVCSDLYDVKEGEAKMKQKGEKTS